MEFELNITFITLDGFINVNKYRYLYFVIMFTVYILILCCNLTIIFLIVFQRSLHEPMYVFIGALLLNSVMFSTVVYPKLLIDILSEKQIISYSACFFQNFILYTSGCSDFFLLTVMSYDRYVSICKPLQYPTIMRKRTVCILLVSAWFIPAFHLSVFHLTLLSLQKELCSFTVRGIFCNGPLYHLLCVDSKILIILTIILVIDISLIPVLFILFTYIRIIMMLYRSCKEVRRKAAQTCLPHLLVLFSFLCLGLCNVIIFSLDSKFSKTVNFITTLQIVIYHPLFNPIIYGLNMKEISRHLKRLLFRDKIN